MAKYTGKTVAVDAPAAQISERFSDLSVMGKYMDRIPAEHRDKIGDLRFEKDAIVVKNPAIGDMAFKVVERTPAKVVFKADGMIPLAVDVNLKEVSADKTDVTTVLDIDIPVMLRPLIGGKLQQVADMFGELIGKLATTSTAL